MRNLIIFCTCCTLLYVMPSCYVKKSWSYLRSDDFNAWANKQQQRLPLNTKESTVLRAQYVFYLNRIRQLQLQAETELDEEAAKKVSTFAAINDPILNLNRSLSNEATRYSWYTELLQLSPHFNSYIASKVALKNRQYDNAFNALAKCPEYHPDIRKQHEKIVKIMLIDFSERFEKEKMAQRYDNLAKEINQLKNIALSHQLSIEQIPYHDSNYTSYGQYLSNIRGAALSEFRQNTASFEKGRKYLLALAEIDKALTLPVSISEKQDLSNLQTHIRDAGIGWHNRLKQQAITDQKYNIAIHQLDTICLISNNRGDCVDEKNLLRSAQLLQSAESLAKFNKYLAAVQKLDTALLLSKEKERITSIQTDIRNKGIIVYEQRKQKTITAQKYDAALAQLDTICLLDKKDRTAERNQLLTAQLLQKAKFAYDAGDKKGAADMLTPLPYYAQGNTEAGAITTKYRNEYGLELLKEADRICKDDGKHDTAISTYKKAKKYLTKPEEAERGKEDCDDYYGAQLLREAARLASEDKYKEAAELAKKAISYVKNKPEARRLCERYKELAIKRVAIVLQANGTAFSTSSEKYAIVDAVAKSIKEDEYTQVVYSQDLPVLRLSDNPAAIAGQVGANYVMAVALDQPTPNKEVDYQGTLYQQKYCTSTSPKDLVWNGYQWVKPITYTPVPVKIFTDKLRISLDVRGYLIKVENGDQINNYSKYLSRSWSNDYWYADKDPVYIRECPCNTACISYRETSFVNSDRFNKTREFPSAFGLIKNDLHSALREIGSNASKDLEAR